jgi:acyl carrier protein
MGDVVSDVIQVIESKMQRTGKPVRLSDRLEDLGIKSIDAVEMIFDLEEKFNISVPYNANDSNLEFETVGDVVAAVQSLLVKSA